MGKFYKYDSFKKAIMSEVNSLKLAFKNFKRDWPTILGYFLVIGIVVVPLILGIAVSIKLLFPSPSLEEQGKETIVFESGAVANFNIDNEQIDTIAQQNNRNEINVVIPNTYSGVLPEPSFVFSLKNESQKIGDSKYATTYMLMAGVAPGTGIQPTIKTLESKRKDITCNATASSTPPGVAVDGKLKGAVAYFYDVFCISQEPIPFDENFPKFAIDFDYQGKFFPK